MNKNAKIKFNEFKCVSSKKSILLTLSFILIFCITKYLFHFSSEIHTGYSDQAFYHTIASSLRYTGVETVNIHTGALKLVPGMIYHYWDLWFLAFQYDLLLLFNTLGLFNNINQFEINTLVFQPTLFVIVFFGLFEISTKLSIRIFNKEDFKIGIVVFVAFLASCHSFLEFGIVHHPKQFIIGSLFFFFILEILENKSNRFNFFYFYPILLFYYPLPGSILIATCFIISINWRNFVNNFHNKQFYIQLIFIIVTLSSFFYYYFFFAQTCITKAYNSNEISWSLLTVLNRIFIYHGYHTLISPLGIIIVLNLIIVFLIYKKKIITNLLYFDFIYCLICFSILNVFVGHLVSSIFYTVPEDFQLYNNDYFCLSLILLFDFLLLFNYLKKNFILSFSVLFLIGVYFLKITFYSRPIFYKGITISYTDYYKLKNKKFDKKNTPIVPDNISSSYILSDIILSFHNSYPRHKKDLCSE